MKCLIIDKVYAGIAEELSKYMEVKTAENLPSIRSKDGFAGFGHCIRKKGSR